MILALSQRSPSFRTILIRDCSRQPREGQQMEEPPEFEFVTFDCYGTLIDWETGIQRAFKQALAGTGLSPSQEAELFELYQEEEKRVESQTPYRPCRQVLAIAASAAARKFGKTIPEKLSTILAEQLPSWSPFPDTNPALEKLATEYTLGILSNVDEDLLA